MQGRVINGLQRLAERLGGFLRSVYYPMERRRINCRPYLDWTPVIVYRLLVNTIFV